MDLMESLDNVHGYSRQSPGSTLRLANFHGLIGYCPPSPWRMSMDFLDIIHGLSQWKVWTLSTDTLDNVQADYTMSTESMGSIDIVHRQRPLFVLNELVKKLNWSRLS